MTLLSLSVMMVLWSLWSADSTDHKFNDDKIKFIVDKKNRRWYTHNRKKKKDFFCFGK